MLPAERLEVCAALFLERVRVEDVRRARKHRGKKAPRWAAEKESNQTKLRI